VSDQRAADRDGTEALGRRLAELLEVDAGDGGPLSLETRQRLLAALVRLYARGWLAERAERHAGPAPFGEAAVSAEEVVVTAAQMLRSAEVTSFELAALFDV
jgi:hypothetical protein